MRLTDREQLFPETANWDAAIRYAVIAAGTRIVQMIREDIRSAERHLTPGLRAALLVLAEEDDA